MNNSKKLCLAITLCISPSLLAGGYAQQTTADQAQAQMRCQLEGLVGKLPIIACKIRDFLKALEEYDPNASYQPLRNAYLFYGAMGIGKTTLVKALAKESDAIILYYSLDELFENRHIPNDPKSESSDNNNSKEKNSSSSNTKKNTESELSTVLANKIKKIYADAEKQRQESKKPVIVIFDDLHDTRNHEFALLIKPYLVKYGGNPYLTTICITNGNLNKLDPSFVSCCQTVECPLPDQEDRFEILLKYILKECHKTDFKFIRDMAKKTSDFATRELEGAIHDARAYTPPKECLSEDDIRTKLTDLQTAKDKKKTYSQRIFNDSWHWLRGKRL